MSAYIRQPGPGPARRPVDGGPTELVPVTRSSTGPPALSRRRLLSAASITGLLAIAGCAGSTSVESDRSEPITIYSGRNENLVGPLIERARAAIRSDIAVRYGSTSEMAATILEEGNNSPADLFLAQDAGALGAIAREGMLVALRAATLKMVDSRFRSAEGLWVGLSGRTRVVVYNTDNVTAADLPQTIQGFTDRQWKDRLGWAPTNGSFQAFVTAIRVSQGDPAALTWLRGIVANNPTVFPKNTPIVEAVITGDIDAGFVNHYYLVRQLAERPNVPARNHYLSGGDPGALINVAGAGILTTSTDYDRALAVVDFMLTDESQRYIAESTFEYPLVEGVEAASGLPPLASIETPDLDLSDLEDLSGTLRLLQDAGVL